MKALAVGWLKGLNNQYVHSLGCCAPAIGSKISNYACLQYISACDALRMNSTSLKFEGIQRVRTDDVYRARHFLLHIHNICPSGRVKNCLVRFAVANHIDYRFEFQNWS